MPSNGKMKPLSRMFGSSQKNDICIACCWVLARVEKNSPSARFAAMNAEARHLGALDTHAATPSGLDGPGQFTSAYDLALIGRVCFDRADFRRYALARTAQIPAQKSPKTGGFQIQNENRLIFNYPGALGGQQEAGEGNGVAVDDPLDVRQRR